MTTKRTKEAPTSEKAPASEKKAAPAPKKPAPKKKAAPPKKAPEKKAPRAHKLSGHRLFFIPKEEGSGADSLRRKDSRRTRSREIIRSAGKRGIMFEDYISKGGHPFDVNRDLKKGAVRAEALKGS